MAHIMGNDGGDMKIDKSMEYLMSIKSDEVDESLIVEEIVVPATSMSEILESSSGVSHSTVDSSPVAATTTTTNTVFLKCKKLAVII